MLEESKTKNNGKESAVAGGSDAVCDNDSWIAGKEYVYICIRKKAEGSYLWHN